LNTNTSRRSVVATSVASILLCTSLARAQEEATTASAPALPLSSLPSEIQTEEIVITGTNIRGSEPAGAPLTILTRDYIEASGFTNVPTLLESLPQNFALANQTGVLTPGVSDPQTQGVAINLRGIGEGTTLVLINGRRPALGFLGAAVDISALPLAAIERVEILRDGASALYGSDAVGGVVNFILRQDFKGAETRLQSAFADASDEYDASQLVGTSWDAGNILGSVQFHKRTLLASTDRPEIVPLGVQPASLLPEDKNYSATLTGRQKFTENLELFGDVLYTNRDSFNLSGQTLFNERYDTENDQVSGTLGLGFWIGGEWKGEISGGYSTYSNDQTLNSDLFKNLLGLGVITMNTDSTVETARLKFDGPIFSLPGGAVLGAFGTEYRSEDFESVQSSSTGIPLGAPFDLDQNVKSAFAEVKIPLVGESNAMSGVRSLALSVAARYDDYSTFGSSTDPKIGFSWEPIAALEVRGSYNTAYLAPRLLDNSLSPNRVSASFQPDPTSPTPTQQVILFGNAVETLKAQESENFTLGFTIKPQNLPQIDVSYYNINYTDRISAPAASAIVLLNNPAAFGGLVIRNPSVDQVNQAIALGQRGGNPFVAFLDAGLTPNPNFDPSTVNAIIDLRRRNLSETQTSGLDLAIQSQFEAGPNKFTWGLDATYILELNQRVTSATAELDTVGTYQNPPEFRGRAAFGWNRGGLQTNLFVNYTDSYIDNRVLTAPVDVDPYTTVDLRLAYRFSNTVVPGLTVAAIGRNILDEEPPKTAVLQPITDLGFDPTNASPLGRQLGVEVLKTW
jgi:iron complex outermembrane recepter protein